MTEAEGSAPAVNGVAAPSGWTEDRLRFWHALGLGPAWRDARRAVGGPVAPQPAIGEFPAAQAGAAQGGGGEAPDDWSTLAAEVSACTRCPLCEGRRQAVLEAGSRGARWMVVGEAPGAEEDLRGEPFVGQAGRLLDNMLLAIGLSRGSGGEAGGRPAVTQGVYIANVIKCRPPGNRNPAPGEVATCEPYLRRQIALVRPRLILAMGKFAAHSLLGNDAPVGSLRGRVHPGTQASCAVPVVVTWHPAYLLRTPADKSRAWADLCLAREAFDRSTEN
jgi:uracil-DNA glycosylase family 4